jgi:hypothetical protein
MLRIDPHHVLEVAAPNDQQPVEALAAQALNPALDDRAPDPRTLPRRP